MESDKIGKRLHDRATRGEALSEEEQTQLEEWYAMQDRAEAEELSLTGLEKLEQLMIQQTILEEQQALLEEQQRLLQLFLGNQE